MATSTSGISFTGLGSGIDTKSIVTELVKIAHAPIDRLTNQKTALTSQKTIISNIKSLLSSLATTVKTFDTPTEFLAYTASSSNTGVAKVASGGEAQPGSYNIKVTEIARTQRTYSDGFSSKTAGGLFGTGTLTITSGTNAPVDITVDGTTSLQDIATEINAHVNGATANIVYDGINYRLQVLSKETGTANAITFDDSALSINLSKSGNQIQAATDAQFSIDGFSMTRSTNIINDAIGGLTIELAGKSASDGAGGLAATQITVAADPTAMKAHVQAFVDGYNAIAKQLATQFSFSGATDDSKLTSDTTLHSLQRQMQAIISSAVSGLSSRYTSLNEIGISTQRDGSLKIDDAKLSKTLSIDPTAVSQLIGGDSAGAVLGVADKLEAMINTYTNFVDGRLKLKEKGYDTRLKDLDKDIARLEDRLTKYQEQMTAKFNAMEQTISTLQSQSSYLTKVSG